MKARSLIVLLLVAAAGAGAYWALQPKPVKVVLVSPTMGSVESTASNTRAGTIKACRRAKISPSLGGQIARLLVREGSAVKAGALLLELSNENLVAELEHAHRQTRALEAQQKAACLRADAQRREAERLTALKRSDAVSLDALDKARSLANALQAECDAARATVQVNAAQAATIRANLERTRLYAPFDGVVARINGELNEYVTPSPPGIPTPAVIDLIDNTCFYVTAPIDEVDAARIRVGMPVRITLDAFRDEVFEGKVRRVADFVLDVEKQARTVDVEAEFARPEDKQRLLAGYSADLEVVIDRRENALTLPAETLVDTDHVYVYDTASGRLSKRKLTIGISNWKTVEVVAGLAPDERVVQSVGRDGVADGVRAEPET